MVYVMMFNVSVVILDLGLALLVDPFSVVDHCLSADHAFCYPVVMLSEGQTLVHSLLTLWFVMAKWVIRS